MAPQEMIPETLIAEDASETAATTTTVETTKPQATVAVVGRPNVGKSTLINRIIGHRHSIVDDTPGVTRDRSYHHAQWTGKHFTLIDTGGLVDEEGIDPFGTLVNQQIQQGITECHTVIFVVDGTTGITPVDMVMAQHIRQSGKAVILAVNKIDTLEQELLIHEFYQLGLDATPMGISALHGTAGIGDMLDALVNSFPEDASTDPPVETEQAIRLALVGRPNVGKSSILNRLLGQDRTIVSDLSGTTRDAIDVPFHWEGQEFVLVDTAGIRKKRKVAYGIECFSVDRSLRAMRQSDVTIMVIDAVDGLTDQDKNLINASHDAGNGLVIVVNKWDLLPEKTPNSTRDLEKELYEAAPHARFVPILSTSALTGQRTTKILEKAVFVAANNRRRVSTSVLNTVMTEAFQLTPPPFVKGKQLKLRYATQVSTAPPTFVLFVNDGKLLKESYRRYLEKQLRASFEFEGTPVRFLIRDRKDEKS